MAAIVSICSPCPFLGVVSHFHPRCHPGHPAEWSSTDSWPASQQRWLKRVVQEEQPPSLLIFAIVHIKASPINKLNLNFQLNYFKAKTAHNITGFIYLYLWHSLVRSGGWWRYTLPRAGILDDENDDNRNDHENEPTIPQTTAPKVLKIMSCQVWWLVWFMA